MLGVVYSMNLKCLLGVLYVRHCSRHRAVNEAEPLPSLWREEKNNKDINSSLQCDDKSAVKKNEAS